MMYLYMIYVVDAQTTQVYNHIEKAFTTWRFGIGLPNSRKHIYQVFNNIKGKLWFVVQEENVYLYCSYYNMLN